MGFCNLRSEPLFYVFICAVVGHEENVPRCQRWMEINVTHVRCSGITGKKFPRSVDSQIQYVC